MRRARLRRSREGPDTARARGELGRGGGGQVDSGTLWKTSGWTRVKNMKQECQDKQCALSRVKRLGARPRGRGARAGARPRAGRARGRGRRISRARPSRGAARSRGPRSGGGRCVARSLRRTCGCAVSCLYIYSACETRVCVRVFEVRVDRAREYSRVNLHLRPCSVENDDSLQRLKNATRIIAPHCRPA